MKKWIALFLIFSLMLSFSGCASDQPETEHDHSSHEEETVATSDEGITSVKEQKMTEETVPEIPDEPVCSYCGSELSDCKACNGTGECYRDVLPGLHICIYCKGNSQCNDCEDGVCTNCKGEGAVRYNEDCTSCRGNGNCTLCDGSGFSNSYNLDGSRRRCSICDGKGSCRDCEGSGKGKLYECYKCKGKGICGTCNGTLISCKKCDNGYTPCNKNNICDACDGSGKYCQPCYYRSHGGGGGAPDSPVTPGPVIDDDLCDWCAGTGVYKCSSCVTGSCISCGGDGYFSSYAAGKIKKTDCSACTGGRCRTCGGDARVNCPYC